MRTLTLALLAAALVAGCGRFDFARAPASGPWFKTTLCGVTLDARERLARLRLQLAVVRSLPRGALVETEFRNPIDRSVLTASRSATGNERALEIVSPPFEQVRALSYETVTRVYESSARKQVIGTHAYVCESLVDQRELGPQFQ